MDQANQIDRNQIRTMLYYCGFKLRPPYVRTKADDEYVKQREACIPEAEAYADQLVPQTKGAKSNGDLWNRVFFMKMNELYRGMS